MNTLSQLEKDLIRDEGDKDKPYKDSEGHWTIGVGHNLDASGLCWEARLAQLRHDIECAQQDLDIHLGWWHHQPEPVQRVLVNMCFNLGIGGLLKFHETLALIHDARYNEAADRLLTLPYAKQVGQRAWRLALLLRSVTP
jgi:lysozyme